MSDRKEGTICRLVSEKVYGFITCPEDGRDYFFHQNQLEGCLFSQLRDGDVVTFTLGAGPKGVEAQDVQLDRNRDESPMGTRTRAQMGLPPAIPERSRRMRRK